MILGYQVEKKKDTNARTVIEEAMTAAKVSVLIVVQIVLQDRSRLIILPQCLASLAFSSIALVTVDNVCVD